MQIILYALLFFRAHRHRYHGVFAPNATLRAAVTALARDASNGVQKQTGQEKETTEDVAEALWRSPARYLWAMLLARIYESAPLSCPQCSVDMRIVASPDFANGNYPYIPVIPCPNRE